MTKTDTSLSRRFASALGSSRCFRAILVLLGLQAAWIALSGRYPMAFDEDFHLGIIRLYAHHLSPFWSSQPENANRFGAVARDPSYLYQYLMSFPYRLISFFTTDQTIQVLILRAINIGLFVSGVALYRRLLLKVGASKALVNACLLVFVLIPIVPLLAAQINYDNLFLPVTALSMLLALRFDTSLAKQRRFDAKTLGQLLIVCLLGSLVKYAFLPVFAAILGFIVVRTWQSYSSKRKAWASALAGWRQLGRGLRLGLVIGLIISGGLFFERYGLNLAHYHTPVPDCSKVLDVKSCSAYGPWIRDYNYKIANVQGPRSPITFTNDWFYGMWLRLFFAVDGPGTGFQTRGPLLIPGISSIVFAVAGLVAVLVAFPKVLKKHDKPVIWLFVAVTATYIVALWLDEYRAFLSTGQPVAINGRYLLPVLLPIFVIVALSAAELFRGKLAWKASLAAAAILCLIWGGGALTYILRSNDNWYWPSPAVRTANHAVQRVLGPVTPGYGRKTQFLH